MYIYRIKDQPSAAGTNQIVRSLTLWEKLLWMCCLFKSYVPFSKINNANLGDKLKLYTIFISNTCPSSPVQMLVRKHPTKNILPITIGETCTTTAKKKTKDVRGEKKTKDN